MKATHTQAVTETVVISPEKVTLELTLLEAKTLGAFLGFVSPSKVRENVEKHDQNYFDVSADECVVSIANDIYFALGRICGNDS